MSENRRATLIPFGAAGGNDAKKAKKPLARSVRITFTLPESNEDTCPVFNYKEELAAAKKKDKKVANGKTPNGLDPFDEEDDDVKRIAMEMEAKYGAGPPTKKKRRGRRDEYADIGMGYDESDSFIDNTDGYDEMIPMNVTTLHGGFYINCGALEFKTDEGVSSDLSSSSSSSSSEDEDEDRPKNRKRVLESSDSDGETETDKEKDKESDKTATQVEKKQKVTPAATSSSSSSAVNASTTNGLPPKKKLTPESNYVKPLPKKAASETDKKKTVKELLKDKRDDEPSKDSKPSKTSDNKEKNVNSVSDKVDAVVSIDKDKDSVAILMEPEKAPSSPCQREPPELSPQKMDVVQLPENLPDNISDIIRKIKEIVQKNMDKKVDLYSGSVNSLLILFERKSKVLGKQSRSRIYQHLSPIFQCKKENLCKRAKNLVMEEDMKRLQNLTSEFKLKVDAMMPQLLEKYERESMRINQIKTMETEESKTIRLPKRKFSWSEETRKMFREIIIIKKRLLIYEGKTKESIDIYLNLFMKSDVKTIWPEGWMTMAALFKLWNTFEKKPPPANVSVELNSSSEVLQSPPTVISSTRDAGGSIKQSKQVKKVVNKEAAPKRTKSPVLTAKDVQKLQSNNALSITPIKPTGAPTQEIPKRPKGSDLTIDKIENSTSVPLFNSNAVNSVIISPIDKPKLSDVHQTHSQPKSTIQARTLYKPDTKDSLSATIEKTTKFVNLPQHPDSDTNSRRVPTEHNIENIMKAANTSKSRLSSSSDTNSEPNKPRISTEIIIPKLEMDGSPISVASNATRIPLENFMPKPMIDIKKETTDDAVIILDDEDGAPAPRTTTNSTDPKRKQASKSKNKYYDAPVYQPVKSASEPKNKIGSKPDVIDNDKSTKKDMKNHEGEDILKLMENLKRLNNMTAYNKNVSTKSAVSGTSSNMSSSPQSSNEQAKTDYSGISFQDVYHRQFLTDLKNSLGAPPSATTSSKNYNSAHSSSSTSHPEKHYSNSNNNYTTAPGALKYKSNYTTQQHTGTFNLVDDMIANLTEFAYPQTASHKQKPPHK